MASFITWKPLYSVGHSSLDEQHKQILDIINDLYIAMEEGTDYDAVKPLLGRLLRYTDTHFACEEHIMRDCDYPDLARHRSLHEALRRKVSGLRTHAGLVMGQDLLHFLKTWWLEHIQEEDQQYSPYVQAVAVGHADKSRAARE